jgi:hypothetical protein
MALDTKHVVVAFFQGFSALSTSITAGRLLCTHSGSQEVIWAATVGMVKVKVRVVSKIHRSRGAAQRREIILEWVAE